MKKSSDRSLDLARAVAVFRPGSPDLEFPVAPDFVSKPPRLNWDDIFQRSEASLAFKTRQPDFEEGRFKTKIAEEFVL